MFRRKQHDVPQLNTTSTADISFMLLVFFLVTSSMTTDKGLGRRLPPLDEQQQERRDISRSEVLQISIDAQDALFVDHQPATAARLQQVVESFVASRPDGRHVIAVETDRHASYNAYFEMQNAIIAAYRSLRRQMALQRYGHPLEQCSQAERDAILQRYPLRISESIDTH